MAGRGSPRGDNNGGGRKPGQKNKATLAREAALTEAVGASKAAEAAGGGKRASTVLAEAMNYFYGLAARYQPGANNPAANEKLFRGYLLDAASMAKALIEYQEPKLQRTTLVGGGGPEEPGQPVEVVHTVRFV